MTKVAEIVRASGFTPEGLKNALLHVEDAPISSEQQARLQVILNGFDNLPLTESRTLLTAAVKCVEDKKSAEYRSIKVKASEARAIVGAYKLVPEFKGQVKTLGWHKAVTAAREALTEHKLTADGSPVLTTEQEAARSEREAKAAAIRMLADKAAKGEVVSVSEEAVTEMLQGLHQHEYLAAIEKQAAGILKVKGIDYSLKLAQELIQQAEKATTEAEKKEQEAPMAKAA